MSVVIIPVTRQTAKPSYSLTTWIVGTLCRSYHAIAYLFLAGHVAPGLAVCDQTIVLSSLYAVVIIGVPLGCSNLPVAATCTVIGN